MKYLAGFEVKTVMGLNFMKILHFHGVRRFRENVIGFPAVRLNRPVFGPVRLLGRFIAGKVYDRLMSTL